MMDPILLCASQAKKLPRDSVLDGLSSTVDTDHNTTLGTGSGGQARRCDSLYDFGEHETCYFSIGVYRRLQI